LNCAEWGIKNNLGTIELEEYKDYINTVEEFARYGFSNSIYRTFIKNDNTFSIKYNYCKCVDKNKWSLMFYDDGDNQCAECAVRIGFRNDFNDLFTALKKSKYDPYPEARFKDLTIDEISLEIRMTRNKCKIHTKLFNYSTDNFVLGDVDDYEDIDNLIIEKLIDLNIIYEKLDDYNGMIEPPIKVYMVNTSD
jgi:hypothetical protein